MARWSPRCTRNPWRRTRRRGPGATTIDSPSAPRTMNEARLGSRSAGCPVSSTPARRPTDAIKLVPQAAHVGDGGRALRDARARTREPCRRHPRHAPCRPAGGVPGCHRVAGAGSRRHVGSRARRCPWGPRACGPPSKPGPLRAHPYRDAQPGRRLDRVEVDERPAAGPDARHQLCCRPDRAHLVVGHLERHQDGALRDGMRTARRGRPAPYRSTGRITTSKPNFSRYAARVEHGVVLDGRGDDAVPRRLPRPRGALDGQVDGLRAAAREDDAARLRTDGAPRRARAPRRAPRARRDRSHVATRDCPTHR